MPGRRHFPCVGSIGDEKRGGLMAGFTKAPFHGAAYVKRGIAKGIVLIFRAVAQPRVEYVSGLLKDLVAGVAKDMMNAHHHEIVGKPNAQRAAITGGDEATDPRTFKERKANKGFAINRVLVHTGEYFTAYAEQTCMFDVRGAMVELMGILPRSAQQGEIINIARFYGREIHALTVLQRVGEVEPLTLTVLSTVWGRLKGMSGATFARLTTNLFADPPAMVEYNEATKKKATAVAVKVKGMLAFAPDWGYDGQGGVSAESG